MAKDYVMPKLAMGMNEGTVIEWLVPEGGHVEKGAPIMVVETEKVSYDLESPETGYLHILVPAGETVPVESPIAQFAATEEELATLTGAAQAATAIPAAISAAAPAAAPGAAQFMPHAFTPTGGGRVKASPLARKIARDAGLELSRVKGSGPGGRIVKRDVLAAMAGGATSAPASVAAPAGPLVEKARIPLKGTMRGTIARRMVESLQTAAQLSSAWECDVTRLLEARQRLVEKEELLGTRVSVNALLIKAIACAVKQVPLANSAIVGDDIVVYDTVNVGIATALPGDTPYDSKLLVPVLKHVERMGLVEIDLGMKALVEKARRGGLTAADLSDSTITLSSTAGLGPPGSTNTPVLNMPNAVIIGPSTPLDKPVVVDGEIVIRTMMPISMTFDHRILDGVPISRFSSYMDACLRNPELMLA